MFEFINKRIDPKIFLLSLGIGLFYCYLTTPTPKLVFEHPTPNNQNNIYYDKKNDKCFKFKAKKVSCTKNSIQK